MIATVVRTAFLNYLFRKHDVAIVRADANNTTLGPS
jgi:hypothetical protein